MLENNKYVRCLLVDFSKAFDIVDHEILLNKLSKMNIHPNIIEWIHSFLTQRSQVTELHCGMSTLSMPRAINRGTVQGSAIGPVLFSVILSDSTALSSENHLFKYADDTNLLISENSDIISQEFDNIKAWTCEKQNGYQSL